MKKKTVYTLLLLICLILLFDPVKCFAKQDSANLINGLSYEVLYPKNQKNKNLGYFDLEMQSDQEQTVSLKLYNSLAKELTIQIRLNGAKTNSVGKVEYGPNKLEADRSLTNDFINVVKGPNKIVIPPKSNKNVDLRIHVPKATFNGLIAGGIQLQPIDDNEEEGKKKDIVVNEFAFLIGILLRVGDITKIKPELELNKTYIAFKNGKSHLFVNISNIHPVYVEEMNVVVQVRKANKQKILFESIKQKMRMAPNSMIDLPIELADKGLTAGKYTAQINIASKNGSNWSWTEDFTINKLEAETLNNDPVEKKININLIFFSLFLIFCLGFLIFIFGYTLMKYKRTEK